MGAVNATRVLVVDDEPMVREVLARYLAKEGYAVDVAEDGEQALAAYAQALPDLVLLDLMLPRIDGLEVFRRIREQAPTAVIMLTARGEETDRVVGLELGADDYVTKPFSPREVVARVRAVLRRSSRATSEPPRVVVVGDLEIDGPNASSVVATCRCGSPGRSSTSSISWHRPPAGRSPAQSSSRTCGTSHGTATRRR